MLVKLASCHIPIFGKREGTLQRLVILEFPFENRTILQDPLPFCELSLDPRSHERALARLSINTHIVFQSG